MSGTVRQLAFDVGELLRVQDSVDGVERVIANVDRQEQLLATEGGDCSPWSRLGLSLPLALTARLEAPTLAASISYNQPIRRK
jgi:hypothetical protein